MGQDGIAPSSLNINHVNLDVSYWFTYLDSINKTLINCPSMLKLICAY